MGRTGRLLGLLEFPPTLGPCFYTTLFLALRLTRGLE